MWTASQIPSSVREPVFRSGHWALWPVSTDAPEEPVTFEDVTGQLRLLSSEDGEADLINGALAAARQTIERRTNRQMVRRKYDYAIDAPDGNEPIKVPRSPLVSVESITSYSVAGDATVMSSADYYVDTLSEPGRICLVGGAQWPSGLRPQNGLVIRLTLGYGTAGSLDGACDPLIVAIKQLATFLYEHRGDGGREFALPPAIELLIADFALPEAG